MAKQSGNMKQASHVLQLPTWASEMDLVYLTSLELCYPKFCSVAS